MNNCDNSQDKDFHDVVLKSWDEVKFDTANMSALKPAYLSTPAIVVVNPKNVMTEPDLVKEFDLKTGKVQDTEFTANYKLVMKSPGTFAVSKTFFTNMCSFIITFYQCNCFLMV